ncbi:uncharacterized protein LOC126849888 [Cataglyphis hispanica]|uniref:uncharacterized protein LOC126849888 n=1 Tax=Cataglyphis hispanica TaxID=1086592 RepID=UPI00217F4D6D|nr:uncharacterized protein LOC126849888 [Cataglyphis hispanica]
MNSLESSTMESSFLTESNTEITRPSTSKSGLQLKSQSPQECIQKKSDNKLKNNEESRSSKSSSAKSFFPELSITSPNTSKCIYILCAKYQCLLNLKKIYRKEKNRLISNDSLFVRDMYLKFIHDIEISEMQTMSEIIEIHENLEKNIEQKVRKVNSDRTTESSENDEGSKDYQNQEKENCQKPQEIDKIPSFKSAEAAVENLEVQKSTDLNAHDIANILSTFISDNRPKTESDEKFIDAMDSPEWLPTLIIEDRQQEEILNQSLETTTEIVKFISPKHRITDRAQKYEELEEYPDKIKKEIKCSSKCLILLSFIMSQILFLILLMLLLYYFKSLDTNKNDEFVDSFATAIVELEKEILDHNATVRVLTEYLERDTPLLKVIALIGETSVDKPYTVDIIKKSLRKRRNNSSSPSLPSFVVLENLRAEHSTVVIDYVKTYQEAYGNQEFTIVAVFKVEQIDDDLTRADINHVINTVKDIFIEANVIMKIIPFKPLSEEALEKYIINTAKNIGQTLSQDQIDYHKRRLIEDFTDCNKRYGCYKDHI